MKLWPDMVRLEAPGDEAAMLVRLGGVRGSAPREAGAFMLVTPTRQYGTIGGGALEYRAAARARALLDEGTKQLEESLILGPDLGQCCGGQVVLRYERLPGAPEDRARQLDALRPAPAPLVLFGAGHVGRALVQVLDGLPFAISWVDARPESFAHEIPAGVNALRVDDPVAQVGKAPENAVFLVMTHDHDLDYRLVRAILQRGDFAFAGLIGSKTKRARFAGRLRRDGVDARVLARLVCPVGMRGIPGKAPKAIAIAIAAQLLSQNTTD